MAARVLSPAQRILIGWLANAGYASKSAIARYFGVSQPTVLNCQRIFEEGLDYDPGLDPAEPYRR